MASSEQRKAGKRATQLRIDDLRSLLTERTRLVAVTHVSNILGTINPIADIAEVVHENGALICVDSVAYAPHRAIDVTAWDVDYLAFSLDPPAIYGLVDFAGGGRMQLDFTDCTLRELQVGMAVEPTFRRKYLDEQRAVSGYFWKVRPVRAGKGA